MLAGISALDPNWGPLCPASCRTYFVDSLGFMWNGAHFDEHPWLRGTDGYFVQDVFGSKGLLASHEVTNLRPVDAIIDVKSARGAHVPSTVIHLGGLFNIFEPGPVLRYAAGVSTLVRRVLADTPFAIATSDSAAALEAFENLGAGSVSHPTLMDWFLRADRVVTSPGLTTLLELGALGRPVTPLPPQNFSQALIVAHTARTWTEAPSIWHWLRKVYDIEPGLSEMEGVRRVNTVNDRLFADAELLDAYHRFFQESVADGRPFPRLLATDGAEQVADTVVAQLSSAAA